MKLIFIRHGESTYSVNGRYTGETDIPLTQTGWWQAYETGRWLGLNYAPNKIWCSPKIRTQETLEALLDGVGSEDSKLVPQSTDIVLDNRLREISYGQWEGLSRPEILENNSLQYENWEKKPSTLRAGGTGETAAEVLDRVREVVDAAIDEKLHTVWFVTHRTVMRTMMASLLHIDLDEYRRRFEQGHASVNIFETEPASPGHGFQLLQANLMPWAFREQP